MASKQNVVRSLNVLNCVVSFCFLDQPIISVAWLLLLFQFIIFSRCINLNSDSAIRLLTCMTSSNKTEEFSWGAIRNLEKLDVLAKYCQLP